MAVYVMNHNAQLYGSVHKDTAPIFTVLFDCDLNDQSC